MQDGKFHYFIIITIRVLLSHDLGCSRRRRKLRSKRRCVSNTQRERLLNNPEAQALLPPRPQRRAQDKGGNTCSAPTARIRASRSCASASVNAARRGPSNGR